MKRVLFCNRCGESCVVDEDEELAPCVVCGCTAFNAIHPAKRSLDWRPYGYSAYDLALLDANRISPLEQRFEVKFLESVVAGGALGAWVVIDHLEGCMLRKFDRALEALARKDAADRNRAVFEVRM